MHGRCFFFVTFLSLFLSIQDSKEKSMPLNQQFRLEGKNCADLCGVQRGLVSKETLVLHWWESITG